MQHFRSLLLTVLNGTVKSAGVPVLWFCASTCILFWSKTFTKRCTNNSLLSHDKTIWFLPCLNWSVKCFWFQNMFWKSINCLRFWWKTYNEILCNTTCQKTFFPCTLRLVRCFQFQGMIWKSEKCRVRKNIALETWRWKSENSNFDFARLLFTLLT